MRAKFIPFIVIAALTPALCAAQQAGAAREIAAGEATFKAICSTCHSQVPPAKLAPPMAMVSKHYRDAFATEREALTAMTSFILAPDSLKMTMPRHAMERFGLMPRIPLSPIQAREVARYVWSLSAP